MRAAINWLRDGFFAPQQEVLAADPGAQPAGIASPSADLDRLDFCDPRHPLFDTALHPRSFQVNGALDAAILDRLCAAVGDPARPDCVEVRWHLLNSLVAGMCVPGACRIGIGFHGDLHLFEPDFAGVRPDDPTAWRIVANARHTPAERFVTLAHELGHIYCGHLGASREAGAWPDARHVETGIAEVEAEMVAALVGLHAKLWPGAVQDAIDRRLEAAEAGILRGTIGPRSVRRAAERICREAGLGPMPDSMFTPSAGGRALTIAPPRAFWEPLG